MEHFQQITTPHLRLMEILLEGHSSSVLAVSELKALVHWSHLHLSLVFNQERQCCRI